MVRDEYDDYKRWEKRKNSMWTRLSQQIKASHVLGIALLIFIAQALYSSGKINKVTAIAIIIPFVILIIFLGFRETEFPKLIPEHIIKQIAQEALERKRMIGIEIPFDAKVRVTLVGALLYESDVITGTSGPTKREVGFEVIKKGLKKTGVIDIHPYNGTIGGIRWERLGYSGKESRDKIIVPVGFTERKATYGTILEGK